MSVWQHFRKKWLLPEVYPLIGAMSVATGLATFAIFNKTNDSIVTWSKKKRTSPDYLDNIDTFVPTGSIFKSSSSRIFGSENVIYDSNNKGIAKAAQQPEPLSFTIRVGAEEDQEEDHADTIIEDVPTFDRTADDNNHFGVSEADQDTISITPVSKATPPSKANLDDFTLTLSDLKDDSAEKVQEILDAAIGVARTTATKVEEAVVPETTDAGDSSSSRA